MKEYVSPTAELIEFENDQVLSAASGPCRCYLDIGIKSDYSVANDELGCCWTDSEDATEYDIHDAGVN